MFDIKSQRVITAEEKLLIGDSSENPIQPKNFIVIRDKVTGKILQVRNNLVVRLGREMTLRHIFNIPYDGEDGAKLHNRTLCLFGIGSGGTPESDPFNPLVPTPGDKDLNHAVPFRVVSATKPLPIDDVVKYFDKVNVGDDTNYMKKTFTNTELVIDEEEDRVFVKVSLDITALDARGQFISELGIYSARIIKDKETYEDIRMFSRITFETEPLSEHTGKGLTVEYYVFA